MLNVPVGPFSASVDIDLTTPCRLQLMLLRSSVRMAGNRRCETLIRMIGLQPRKGNIPQLPDHG